MSGAQEATINKILVIDDDPQIVHLIQIFLEKENYEVLTADNGETGLACVVSQEPNLIILDAMMPVMDGFELLKRLKSEETTAKIPVIMLTARAQDEDVFNGWKLGVHLYLTKPIELPELMRHVKLISRSHDTEDTYRIHN